jgi:alanyl-tRNA synthetase
MFKTSQLAGLQWTVFLDENQVFTGYEQLEGKSAVLRTTTTATGQRLIVPKTCPFYAESGGQVGDRGTVVLHGNTVGVVDVQMVDGYRTLVLDAEYQDAVDADTVLEQTVDSERRRLTQANHSCTHLLHKVLKDVVGEHAEQRGSWVGPTHLRFDFPNNEAVSKDQLAEVERRVNTLIQADLDVSANITSLDEAKSQGVTALFGEKYGDEVRVVSMGDASMELCGGIHLKRTGEAMAFVIRSESSVASGIRRIEATTGPAALAELFEGRGRVKAMSSKLQTQPQEIEDRVSQLQTEHQQQRKDIARLKRELVMVRLQESLASLPMMGDTPYLAEILDDVDAGDLRGCADALRAQHSELPMLLACRGKNKAGVLISFPKSWVKEKGAHAGKTLKPLGKFIQGGGGGAPELAQAGGKNPDGLGDVLAGFKADLEKIALDS